MTQIVKLKDYKTKSKELRVFGSWQKRFGECCSLSTKLSDISDKTLVLLSKPGEEAAMAYYEIILGVLGLGGAAKFYYLPNEQQLKIIDIHFLLIDLVRFEMMRRMGWITNYPFESDSIIDIIEFYEKRKDELAGLHPVLSPSHPEYDFYCKQNAREKEMFIRRLIPKVLEEFEQSLKE